MNYFRKKSETVVISRWKIILLALVVFLISVHFLVDDINVNTNILVEHTRNQFEVTHQDDLIHISDSTPQIGQILVKQIPLKQLQFEKVNTFPNFNPPKI